MHVWIDCDMARFGYLLFSTSFMCRCNLQHERIAVSQFLFRILVTTDRICLEVTDIWYDTSEGRSSESLRLLDLLTTSQSL